MSTLFGRLRRTPVRSTLDISTIDDYIAAVAELGWLNPVPGVHQTMPGEQSAEGPPVDFRAMATQVFGSSSVVFACMLARMLVFSEARFQYQRMRKGRPSDLFGDATLSLLENPWHGGVTADLLLRMIMDADLAGNSYLVEDAGEVVRLRPDWVDIVMTPRMTNRGGRTSTMGFRRVGYLYYEDGVRDERGVPFLPDEVAHWAPIPDPLASWRGMSWLTPVTRDVQADTAMTRHKKRFMDNAATPNLVIKHAPQVTPKQMLAFKSVLEDTYAGPDNAGKTLHIGGGADLTVVGKDFQQIDLRSVQGAGETRIAAAAGTPPVIVGLSEGLASATYSNYGQARRRFADGTLRPLWRGAAGSLAVLRPAPADARLWYDVRDVSFLREDSKDAADITRIQASTIRQLVDGGFEPGSVVAAVNAGDVTLLVHSGRLSVQLQRPGQAADGSATDSSGEDPPPDDPAATNGRSFVPIPLELMTRG